LPSLPAEEKPVKEATPSPFGAAAHTDSLVLNIDSVGNLSATRPIHDLDEFLAAQAKASQLANHMTAADIKAGRELPTTVVIRADQKTPYEKVNQVIKACQKHGFRKFTLETAKAERSLYTHPIVYTAIAFLRIAMQESLAPGGGAPLPTDRDRFEIYKNTQAALVTSRMILRVALQNPKVARLPSIQRQRAAGDPEKWLADGLRVFFPGKAEVMGVSFRSDDRKEAVAVVNAVIEAYLAEVVNAERSRKQSRLNDLEHLYAERDQEARKKREALKTMAREAGTSDTGGLGMREKLALEELALNRQELAKFQADLRRYEVDLAVQKAFLEDAKDKDRAPILKEIKRLEVSLKVATQQRDELVKQINKMYGAAEKFGSTSVSMDMLRTDLKNLDTVQAQLSSEMEKLKVEINSAPRVTMLQPAE
jgi:biopolymer transport protein ExbD/uncharacterized protein involved in exopolysaccharide biosynthesis